MNTALIGLDYIVDIMHPDGRIARCAEQAALRGVVARFNRALAVAEQ
ncbi:MAG: cysteine hydrolase, partial [Pseudomonas aeruginosa]|nr:cysteine hydrolase [Pseudomonas aeruginosa]